MTTREARKAAREERAAIEAIGDSIVDELPETLPLPTIANVRLTAKLGECDAWLSFRDGQSDSATLAALEAANWKPVPATLAQYGNWRASPKPGTPEELPEESSRTTLTNCEAISPLWIIPNQFGRPEAIAFYTTPTGKLVRIKVSAPNTAGITATRKNNNRGEWWYERGTAKLRFPDSWHSIETAEGTVVANVSAQSRAYVDTEQGISGAIYFQPLTEQTEFPLTPAQMLRILEQA